MYSFPRPIIIGENAEIEDRVTFHSLKGTSIRIGKNLDTDDNIVFHGPLEVGDNLTIEDDAVLFRSKVGNNVTIATGAYSCWRDMARRSASARRGNYYDPGTSRCIAIA